MEEIKVKQQLTNEITKTCLNIKEEMIEQNESPSQQKIVEKVCYTLKIIIFIQTFVFSHCSNK